VNDECSPEAGHVVELLLIISLNQDLTRSQPVCDGCQRWWRV